jgi:hypothetical protein
MNRFISNALGLSAVGALSLCGWACFQVGSAVRSIQPQASTLLQRWTPGAGKANAVIDAAYNAIHNTSDNVNRPCGAGKPCGFLAQTGKTVVKVGDAVVTTQLLERKTALEGSQTLLGVSQHVNAAADASTGLLNAGTVALNRLPALEDASAGAVQNFNRLISSKSLSDAIEGTAGMTQHGSAILADAQQVADKATADYLKPVPWWKQPIQKAGALIDIGAAVARHTP